jgi:hypothetical protein
MYLYRPFLKRRECTDNQIRLPRGGHTILYKTLIFIATFALAYFVAFSILEAEAPRPEIQSTDTVLTAPITPPQKPQNALTLKGNCEEYRSIVSQYEWDVEVVLQIMSHESGCNPSAVNDNPKTGDLSIGLMQINIYGENAKYRPSMEILKIPSENIAFAYKLWKSSGFQSQWSVCKDKVRCI